MTVDPTDSPARAESLTCPTMPVSMRMKVGSAMSCPKVGIAMEMSWRSMSRDDAGGGVGGGVDAGMGEDAAGDEGAAAGEEGVGASDEGAAESVWELMRPA